MLIRLEIPPSTIQFNILFFTKILNLKGCGLKELMVYCDKTWKSFKFS